MKKDLEKFASYFIREWLMLFILAAVLQNYFGGLFGGFFLIGNLIGKTLRGE